MKIVILGPAHSSHTFKWVKGISKKNVQILLISFANANSYDYSELSNVILKTYPVNGGNLNGLKSKFIAVKHISRIKSEIKRFNPDLVHSFYASSYGLIGALLNYENYIVSVWGSDVIEFPKRSIVHKGLLKFIFRRAKLIQCTSKNLMDEVSLYSQNTAEVVPFGVDTNLFSKKESHQKENDVQIGVVKGLEPIYGVETLIRAVIKICSNSQYNLRLIILGEGSEKEKYVSLVKSLNAEDVVDFKGYVQNDLLPDFYNSFDLVVVPSLRESFGLSLLEAMSSEVPVLASRISGFLEVANDQLITYFEPGNEDDLVQKMEQFLKNPELAMSRTMAARNHVKLLYGVEKCMENQMKIYQRLCRNV